MVESGPFILSGGVVLTPSGWKETDLKVADGKITDRLDRRAREIDVTGMTLVPGFIDVQVNGGWGYNLQSDPSTVWALADNLTSVGVTSFLPTLTTDGIGNRHKAFDSWLEGPPDRAGFAGADPLGWHLEGPWLAPSRHGAHSRHLLKPIPSSIPASYTPRCGVRMVTLAPELAGSLWAIDQLRSQGVVVSLGHSEATMAQAKRAVEAGATMGTHLFNAMSGLDHRSVGLAAALLLDDMYVGVIVDGYHVAPEMIDLSWRLASSRILIVSDLVAARGDTDDEGLPMVNSEGTLAGATLGLDGAISNLMAFTGCGLAEAVRSVTEVPARCLGLADRGWLEPGLRADVVALDSAGTVALTLVEGRVAHDAR